MRTTATNVWWTTKHINADLFLSTGKPGTPAGDFERDTWAELARLATNVPEAGIHFQGISAIAQRLRILEVDQM